jgi:hypothetical protein
VTPAIKHGFPTVKAKNRVNAGDRVKVEIGDDQLIPYFQFSCKITSSLDCKKT